MGVMASVVPKAAPPAAGSHDIIDKRPRVITKAIAVAGQNYVPLELIPVRKEADPAHLYEAMSTKALIASWPPLGQVIETESKSGSEHTQSFVATLTTDDASKAFDWEVALWYQEGKASEWQEVALSKQAGDIAGSASDRCAIVFETSVKAKDSIRFTLKFRSAASSPWTWVKDHQGAADGIVSIKQDITPALAKNDLGEFISGLNPTWKVEKHRSQTPETSVWTVEVPIGAAANDESAFSDVVFGQPWKGDILRWMALVRIWTPWLSPRHGNADFELDKEAVLAAFLERGQGRHLVLLTVSGADVQATLRSNGDGHVVLGMRNDSDEDAFATVVVGLGNSFETANSAAIYHSRSVATAMAAVDEDEDKEMRAQLDDVKPEWVENWFDGLTYCTWNGLGQRLTEDKILLALDTLEKSNIHITNLIIDDNWQSINYPEGAKGQWQQEWLRFEADAEAFPNGLKSTVTKLREKNPKLKHIAVWHALLGYWAGIAPEGDIAKKYKTREVIRIDAERRHLPMGGKMAVVDSSDAHRFYDDFYTFLSSCGIDAVKTDAQYMLDTLTSASARRSLTPTYLRAWTLAALRHFSIKVISCMSQTPAAIFLSQLPTNRPPMLLRNSDDFFPDIKESHPWHVFANSCNSLLNQHLNVVPDWDMFQTVHGYSGFHAAARAVSGGPVYITDVPGQHDAALIAQLTGTTPDGRTVIFRTSNVGKTISPYTAYDDAVLCKVGTFHGAARMGTGLLGVFNTSVRPLSELLHIGQFPGVTDQAEYVVRSHVSGAVTEGMQLSAPGMRALLPISLDVGEYDILTACPAIGITDVDLGGDSTVYVANLGLLGKMAGAAAVVAWHPEVSETRKVCVTSSFKALGVWGLYISALPKMRDVLADRLLVLLRGQVVPFACVSVDEQSEVVLRVDVERAWREMGLLPGYGNEVEVKLYILPEGHQKESEQ